MGLTSGYVSHVPPNDCRRSAALPVLDQLRYRLELFRFAHIARQDAGRASDLVFPCTPISHTRCLHKHRTNAGHHLALRQVTMAHQACPPLVELLPAKGVHERGQFRVDRLFDQLARSIAEDVSKWVGGKSRWIGQLSNGILLVVAYPFLGRELKAFERRHDMPPFRTSPTFARFSKAHQLCHLLTT